ncbi:CLUMA_CG021594, isoform A [Clunio marinus]|uniref:CLUMA_CG021594, isoform A n=1 Tax=Clunio marinus TaxID=568069 RepID=A0A1J1J8V8_9DIPT|nr:CLUMA_CG021594, isoform A [Clunio marinus]
MEIPRVLNMQGRNFNLMLKLQNKIFLTQIILTTEQLFSRQENSLSKTFNNTKEAQLAEDFHYQQESKKKKYLNERKRCFLTIKAIEWKKNFSQTNSKACFTITML